MKKALAVLLSMSIVLALFGCTKAEETKKKKKTKKTKDTEITETTEVPTTPEDDPTTSDGSDDPTTNTTAAPDIQTSTNLHSQVDMNTHGCAEIINDDNFIRVDGINYELNRIRFTTDRYPELREKVDEFYNDLENRLTQRFEERKASGISSDTYYEDQCYADTYIYRDDSYIFSFIVKTPEDISSFDDGCTSHSYWSETGEEISILDIITNYDIFSASLTTLGQKYNIPDENILSMKDGVKNGTADFALTYDGLVLFEDYYSVKLPLDQIEEGVDTRYFGAAPEVYFLDFNLDGTLKWDMDGDGTPEDIWLEPKFENPNDSILVTSVIIHVGDEAFEVKDGIWGEFYPQYGSFYLMKAPDTFYIFMSVGIDEGIEEAGYRYDNGTWTYTGSFEDSTYDHPYDPQRVRMGSCIGNLGTNYMYSYFDMTDGSGIPKHLGDLFFASSYYLATNADLVFTTYDDNGAPADEWKVSARTIIQVLSFDADSNLLYVYVYSRRTDEYVYASIEMQQDPWSVGGIPVDEAFLGLHYGG